MPWEVEVDIALPCATQNELDREDAEKLIGSGCICLCEGRQHRRVPEGDRCDGGSGTSLVIAVATVKLM